MNGSFFNKIPYLKLWELPTLMDALEIRNELNKILTSRCFRSRRVLCSFLAYVVESHLAGEAPNQKDIALHALKKSSDFNDNPTFSRSEF